MAAPAADITALGHLALYNLRRRRPLAPDPARDEAQAAETSLTRFLPAAWPILEPVTPFVPNWHLDYVCEMLTAVTNGEIRRLVINVPPRSLKSTLVTIDWPAWTWITQPGTRWLFASYSQDLSKDHSVKRRLLVQSDWYQRYWGARFRLADDQNEKMKFTNDRQGVMFATSMLGSATGQGGDYIVIDDPHNPRGVESDAERLSTIEAFDLTFSTRLNDPRTGAIIIVMQRLHEQDLTGHVLARGGWHHVKLPMRADDRERVVYPVSGTVHERAPGDLLHPERLGPAEVAQLETDLGSYGTAGQLQQRPAPAEGGKLKRHWWRFWHHPDAPLPPVAVKRADGSIYLCPCEPLPAAWDQQIQSWDLAFKDAKESDFVAGGVWGQAGANAYLLARVHDRLNVLATVDAILALTAAWPKASAKLIEDKANGPAVMQMLKNRVPGLIAVEPQGGKMARVMAVSPFVESHNVYLPHPALLPEIADFLNECAAFPNGAHDDEVDQMTQALMRLLVAPKSRRLVTGG